MAVQSSWNVPVVQYLQGMRVGGRPRPFKFGALEAMIGETYSTDSPLILIKWEILLERALIDHVVARTHMNRRAKVPEQEWWEFPHHLSNIAPAQP